MAHIPVNHHLRPLYRTLAGLCGVYVLTFGIVAVVRTRSLPFLAQHGLPSSLGLRANQAFAILSIVVGAVLLVGALIGRNVDRWINLVGGVIFLVAGLAMMVLLQTERNYLGFTMATCIVSFVIGMFLLTAGLYGKVGSVGDVDREERWRHGTTEAKEAQADEAPAESGASGAEAVAR
jgi:Na+/melibiose symporter-like transporter